MNENPNIPPPYVLFGLIAALVLLLLGHMVV